jgi:hypothetical protein
MIALAGSLAVVAAAAPRPARADVLDWLNRRVEGLLASGKEEPDVSPQFDRYLRMLASPQVQPGPGPDPGPAPVPYRPRLSEALREITSDGGGAADRDTAFFYQNTYLLGLLGAKLGFRTPFRIAGHLGAGLDPGSQLLARILDDLKRTAEATPLMKLHRRVERGMAQVQSTHQLMVESREVLEAALGPLRRAGDLLDRLVAEHGRLQSIPAVLGASQTLRKGADNVGAAISALTSCATHFRLAFAELRRALAELDHLSAHAAHGDSEHFTLRDRPDTVRSVSGHLGAATAAMKEAGIVVRTNLALVRLNHQGLMQILATLNASPLARRAREEAGVSRALADGPLVAGPPPLARVNPRLVEGVAALSAVGRDLEARRVRLEQWAAALRAFRPEPIVVDELPDWVFHGSTLPQRDRKWTDYSLLPERQSDVDGLIAMLEADLRVGSTAADAARAESARLRLDEELGDVPPQAVSAASSSPPASLPPASPRPADAPAPASAPAAPYELPPWF